MNGIIELKEARAKNQEEWARDQEARAKQEEAQKNILNFWGVRVMIMLLPMGVVQLQVKTLFG